MPHFYWILILVGLCALVFVAGWLLDKYDREDL